MGPETVEGGMSSPLRVEMLEKKAEREREVLENHVVEFRRNVKEKLDVKRNVRAHVWPLAGIVAIAGLGVGYSLIGAFTRD